MASLKKILILSYEFPPLIGGAGVYAHDITMGLHKNGHEISLITYNHGGANNSVLSRVIAQGIKVSIVPNVKYVHFLFFYWKLRMLTTKYKYDLIVFNDGRSKRIGALFQNSLSEVLPVSVSILHGNEKSAMFDAPSFLQKLTGLRNKNRSFFLKQKRIIVVSKNEFDIWSNTDFRQKLKLVNHGIDTDIFYRRTEEQKKAIRLKYGIPDSVRIIFSASRLVKEKGHEVLLESFAQIVKERLDVKLYIAGTGPNELILEKQIDSLGLTQQAILLGRMDRTKLSEWYAIATVFVLPSQFYESFGLVYLEAAACGTLSIASDRGGTQDAIVNGVTGFLVGALDTTELKNRIISVLDNESLNERLSLAAYDRTVSRFTNTIMAKNLIDNCYQDD